MLVRIAFTFIFFVGLANLTHAQARCGLQDLSLCANQTICTLAIEGKDGKLIFRSQESAKPWVQEAKRRGLSCSVEGTKVKEDVKNKLPIEAEFVTRDEIDLSDFMREFGFRYATAPQNQREISDPNFATNVIIDLQKSINVTDDGIWGPGSRKALLNWVVLHENRDTPGVKITRISLLTNYDRSVISSDLLTLFSKTWSDAKSSFNKVSQFVDPNGLETKTFSETQESTNEPGPTKNSSPTSFAELQQENDILKNDHISFSKQIQRLKAENKQLKNALQEVGSRFKKSQRTIETLEETLLDSENEQFKAGEKISQLEAKIRDLTQKLEKINAETKEKNVAESPKETLEDTAEQQHESKLKVFSLSVSHSENYQFDPYFCGFKIVFNPNPIRSKQEEFFFYFNPENNLYLANLSEEISSEIGNSSESYLNDVIFETQNESLCDPVAPVQDTTFKRSNDGTLYLTNVELISINDPQEEGPNLLEQLGIENERPDKKIESELIERLSERIRILENELGSLSSVNEQQVELAKRIRSIELSLQQNANNVELNVSKTEPQESKIEGNYIEGRAVLADKLIGSAGDDLFDGKGGRDQIDGGEGIDTLLIFENSSSFKVVTLGGVTKVTGLKISAIYGIKETITLINVEFIKFADRTVSLVETSKKDEGQKRKRDIIKFP